MSARPATDATEVAPKGRGLVRATVALLVVLIVVGLGLTAFDDSLASASTSDTVRLIIGLVLTVVPALLWLGLFYAQDRLEPEPHRYVLGLLVLGALMGGAVEQPLLRNVFQVQQWAELGTLTNLSTTVLLNGVLTAALVYAALRFTVVPTPEFDERVDGIVYGTAAALGLGIAANLGYLFDHGTVSIGVGMLQIIVTSLAYATFGALVGYFLGLIKPGGGPGWLAGVGVLVAGIVHGLYDYVTGLFTAATSGLDYNPWPALISTAIYAALVFAVVFVLVKRSVGRFAATEGA